MIRRKAPVATNTQLYAQRSQKLLGHILRHPETPEHRVVFTPAMAFRRLGDKLRRGAPRLHWGEQTLAHAYQRAEFLQNTQYTPKIRDYGNVFYQIPDRHTVTSSYPSGPHHLLDTTRHVNYLRPLANNKASWKNILGC